MSDSKAVALCQEADAEKNVTKGKWSALHQRQIDNYAPSVSHVLENMEFQDGIGS